MKLKISKIVLLCSIFVLLFLISLNVEDTRLFWSFFFPLFIVWEYTDWSVNNTNKVASRFRHISGLPLMIFIAITFVMELIFSPSSLQNQMIVLCFGIFLHITIYYLILLPLLPLFRRYLYASTCATLWMFPSFLYVNYYLQMERPLIIIPASPIFIHGIFWIWLVGFLLFFGFQICSHIFFRHQVLKYATPISDSAILEIWNTELERAETKPPFPEIIRSTAISSPLSIGLWKKKICVVLPNQHYTTQELTLIFRHELTHISREDGWSKFFFAFCTSICWFNPLMWIAMKKSAEDMELCCDETVLLDVDEPTRKHYAELILNTAETERGFTTCLSASAATMRYRLKSIMQPTQKYSAPLLVGIIVLVLYLTCGYVTLAYSGKTGKDVLLPSQHGELYTLQECYIWENQHKIPKTVLNEAALQTYLSSLTMEELIGHYHFEQSEARFVLCYESDSHTIIISLFDDFAEVATLPPDKEIIQYHISDDIDWDLLNQLTTPS